jgi:hypothetical protein
MKPTAIHLSPLPPSCPQHPLFDKFRFHCLRRHHPRHPPQSDVPFQNEPPPEGEGCTSTRRASHGLMSRPPRYRCRHPLRQHRSPLPVFLRAVHSLGSRCSLLRPSPPRYHRFDSPTVSAGLKLPFQPSVWSSVNKRANTRAKDGNKDKDKDRGN